MFDIDMYPLCRVTDTQVYDECFSFLPDAFTGHVTFPSSDAVCVRSRLRLRTICNFPLDIYQEFRDILYPRPVPSRDCRRGERRRDEINLGQSSPFSFREKETTVFLRSHSPRPSPHSTLERQSNRNEAARYVKYVVAFTPRTLVCDAIDG